MSEPPNSFGRISFMGQAVTQLRRFTEHSSGLRYVWNSAPALSLAGVGIRVVQGILPWVGLYLVKLLIDALADALRRPEQEEIATAVLRILFAMVLWRSSPLLPLLSPVWCTEHMRNYSRPHGCVLIRSLWRSISSITKMQRIMIRCTELKRRLRTGRRDS